MHIMQQSPVPTQCILTVSSATRTNLAHCSATGGLGFFSATATATTAARVAGPWQCFETCVQ